MKVIVSKKSHFDSAHHLPGYDGKCSRIHGHRWEIEAGVSGSINPKTGMVIDFHDLDSVIQKRVLDRLDHDDLNSSFPLPTAENITVGIFTYIEPYLAQRGVKLEWVKVWESPDSCCEVRE
jgi:6-pyruvoyltetrahydropterin/6-carboxytetrahydropterin synthase